MNNQAEDFDEIEVSATYSEENRFGDGRTMVQGVREQGLSLDGQQLFHRWSQCQHDIIIVNQMREGKFLHLGYDQLD